MSTPFAEVTVRTHRQRFQLPVVTSLQHGIVVLLSKHTQDSNTATNNNNQYNSQPTNKNASTFDLPSPPFLRTLFPKNARRRKQRQNTTDNDTTRQQKETTRAEQTAEDILRRGRTDQRTDGRRSDAATEGDNEQRASKQADKTTTTALPSIAVRRSPRSRVLDYTGYTIVSGRFNHSTKG